MSSDAPRRDPTPYVPRLALELALAELSELIGKTPACAVLTGEAGLGKTLLLHVLRERLSGAFECLYVPFGRLAPAGLWSEVAVAIGLGSGDDDRGAVLGRARSLAADGSGLVLLMDDAGAMPAAVETDLIAACETPGLSLVLAFASDELARRGALPAHVRRIDLGPPLTLAETRAYAQARLRQLDPGGASSARLGARAVAAMHDASGGVPARLNVLLDAWRGSSASEDSAPAAIERTLPERAPQRPPAAASEPTSGPHRAAERAPALARLLRGLRAQLEQPLVQLAVAALFILSIGGFWLFALQRSGGAASVGVPVERFEATRPEPASKLAPAAEQATPGPAAPAPVPATPVEEPAAPPASSASAKAARSPAPARAKRVAAAGLRSASQPEPAPPARLLSEEPVEVVSARFPDEHVPAALEPAPLAPRPSGPLLNVNAAPWAEIELDGQPVGETPLGELAVAPGRHVVTATLPDGRVIERNIEARGGDLYLVFR